LVVASRGGSGWLRRWLWRLVGGRWVKVPREDAADWGAVAMEEDIEAMGGFDAIPEGAPWQRKA